MAFLNPILTYGITADLPIVVVCAWLVYRFSKKRKNKDSKIEIVNKDIDLNIGSKITENDINNKDVSDHWGLAKEIDINKLTNALAESLKAIDTDKIINHFILAGLMVVKLIKELIKILKINKVDISTVDNDNILTNTMKSDLLKMKDKEIKEFSSGIELVKDLDKNELINLLLQNKIAQFKFINNKRKKELGKLTTVELKKLIKGKNKIYKLRKSELIDLIIEEQRLVE